MPQNNQAFFDAIIAGGCGGTLERWITSASSSNYDSLVDAVEAFATAIDAAIPFDADISISKINLLQSITQGTVADRNLASIDSNTFADIAAAIAAAFAQGSTRLNNEPSLGGGGGDPIYRQLWLDTSAAGGGNGFIGAPYNTWEDAVAPLQASGGSDPWLIFINQDINVSGEPLPNIGAGGHDVGRVKFQGVLQSSAYGSDSTTLTALEIGFQDGGSIQVDFENILMQGLTMGAGVDALFLTGNNARIVGVSETEPVSASSRLVNCSLVGMTLPLMGLRMYGNTIEQDISIADGFLYEVEVLDSTTIAWTGTLSLTNCTFKPGVTLTGGTLEIDSSSYASFLRNSVTFTGTLAVKGDIPNVTVATLPTAANGTGCVFMVTDGFDGTPGLVWSDGSAYWLLATRMGAISDTIVETTIVGGVVTATTPDLVLDTEGGAASDDLDTIDGGVYGQIIRVSAASNARTVVLKDGVGNLVLSGDITLDNSQDMVLLIRYGSWVQLAPVSNNAT